MDDDDDDDSSMGSNGSVDSSSPFVNHLNSGSSRVFGTPSLRPKQVDGISRIIFDPSSKGKGRLLVVDRTGGGKP